MSVALSISHIVPESEHTAETTAVDRSQKLKKANPMFREFREILIDHRQRGFKDEFQYRCDLARQQWLRIHQEKVSRS